MCVWGGGRAVGPAPPKRKPFVTDADAGSRCGRFGGLWAAPPPACDLAAAVAGAGRGSCGSAAARCLSVRARAESTGWTLTRCASDCVTPAV